MPVRGKRGNPKPGFPLFPPPLEIADDFHIPTGPTHPVYTHQRRPNTSEKCYPCRRAKVLPMSPTVQIRNGTPTVREGRSTTDFFGYLIATGCLGW
jgi:hypothetical protein